MYLYALRDLSWSDLPQDKIMYNFSVNILKFVVHEGVKLYFPPFVSETKRNALQSVTHHQIYMK